MVMLAGLNELVLRQFVLRFPVPALLLCYGQVT